MHINSFNIMPWQADDCVDMKRNVLTVSAMAGRSNC